MKSFLQSTPSITRMGLVFGLIALGFLAERLHAESEKKNPSDPVTASRNENGTSGSSLPSNADPNLAESPDGGFIYEPTGKRDPFKSFFADDIPKIEDSGPGDPGLQAPIDRLDAYDLGQLKVVAILSSVENPKALIRSPTGKTFLVKKDTKVGRNKGFVAAVRDGEVVVFELSQDGKSPSTRVLTLQK